MGLNDAPNEEQIRRENNQREMERRMELHAEMERRFAHGREELEAIQRRRQEDERRRAELELEQLRQIDNLLFERRQQQH